MLILTERTPNPEALKFIPPRPLTGGGHWSFERGAPAAASPLAERLLAIPGVRRVFIAADFLTVLRDSEAEDWNELKYQVLDVLAEHLGAGLPAVDEAAAPAPAVAEDGLEAEIRAVIDRYVRPGVARDGGEVVIDHFDAASGVLWIRMEGACGGCPSSRLTLKSGVEQVVRRHVPEVLAVEELKAPAPAKSPSRIRQWLAKAGGGMSKGKGTVFTHGGEEIRTAAAGRPRG